MAVNFLKQIQVKVPNRSGEDLSFQHLLTTKPGTLVPIFWHEVIPGTKCYLKSAISASLPPLASDTFMRCKLKLEAFFVPFRQLSAAFSPWLTGEKVYNVNTNAEENAVIPTAVISDLTHCGPGSLADYLGFKLQTITDPVPVNIYPFLAYHWIWDQMYRNSKVQKRAFSIPSYGSNVADSYSKAGFLPYINTAASLNPIDIGVDYASTRMNDAKFLFDLRQRNFDTDYFTACTPNPQSVVNPAAVSFTVDEDGNGQFTISALRAQNSLQQYLERQNLAGFRLTEYVKANYGVNLSEGLAQMPLFLGRQSIDVYSKGVDSTANVEGTTQNPFAGSTGARYGSAYAIGNDTLIQDFEAKEPGIVMVMASLVPKVTYASGVDRLLMHFVSQSSQGDVANPLLQNVGQQPVYSQELYSTNTDSIFGYNDRFAEFMCKNDKVSGLLRDGESLQSFALQRSFGLLPPVIGSDFLEIPTSYMDQVSAVSGSISGYGVWIDSFFEFKVSQPLHQYSVPSLQDPAYEHGKGVIISRSGQMVD